MRNVPIQELNEQQPDPGTGCLLAVVVSSVLWGAFLGFIFGVFS